MPVVRVPDELFARLQRHAVPLVDSVADVLQRILDQYERALPAGAGPKPDSPSRSDAQPYKSFPELWGALVAEFNRLNPRYRANPKALGSKYKVIWIGPRDVHYEWFVRRRDSRLDVCLHFESPNRATNLKRIEPVAANADQISKGVEFEFVTGPWGRNWAQAMFRVPYSGGFPDHAAVLRAAETMRLLMERTADLVGQANCNENGS